MRVLLMVLAVQAVADPLKVTSTPCVVNGPSLEYADDIEQGGMVETPKGELAIVDGDGKLSQPLRGLMQNGQIRDLCCGSVFVIVPPPVYRPSARGAAAARYRAPYR